jgi:hypothetical protein
VTRGRRDLFPKFCIAAGVMLPVAAGHAAPVSVSIAFTSITATFAEAADPYDATEPGWGVWQNGLVNGTPFSVAATAPPYATSGSAGYAISTPTAHTLALLPGTTSVTFADQLGWVWEASGYKYEPWPRDPSFANAIGFTGASNIDVQPGQVFSLGTFSVTNGSWFSTANGGIAPTQVGFELTTHSTDSALDGHLFSGTFVYKTAVAPGGTELANADIYWIAERPDLGAARIFELGSSQGNTGTFDLRGYVGSLELTALSNPMGAAVLTDSIAELAPVPLPAAGWLLLSGVGGLGALVRRRVMPRTATAV